MAKPEAKSKQEKGDEDLTFEQALGKLKKNVALLEEEKLSPEETIRLVEDSNRLAKLCLEKLEQISE